MGNATLTRQELADSISKELNFNRQQSNKLLDHALDAMIESIVDKGQLKLSAFGTFNVLCKDTRIGRNPKTGKEVPIAPRRSLSFKASTHLKNKVQNAPSN